MNSHIIKAPRIFIKSILLCFLLTAFLAVPVQSQSTPVPTPLPRLTNPTVMAPCGLPASPAEFTSDSTVTTFNMTANCTFNTGLIVGPSLFLVFESGVFTINGNGYSIIGIGPSDKGAIFVGSASTLNLNNVAIRQTGIAVETRDFARLNGSNILIRDNTHTHIDNTQTYIFLSAEGAQVQLENVWFLNNHSTANAADRGSALTLGGGPTRITNAIFQGNTGAPNVVVNNAGALEFNGCLTFSGNLQADGTTAATNYSGSNITDSNSGACPEAGFSYWLSLTPAPPSGRSQKKEKIPTATATPRPLAVTCPALSQFGIAVQATYGLASGVQCQRIDGGGIGLQSIVEDGFIDAVDIWGYVEQGVEVCFPQSGRLLFLDARTMPRAIGPLGSTVVNGMTCALIASPGSIVLMPN